MRSRHLTQISMGQVVLAEHLQGCVPEGRARAQDVCGEREEQAGDGQQALPSTLGRPPRLRAALRAACACLPAVMHGQRARLRESVTGLGKCSRQLPRLSCLTAAP